MFSSGASTLKVSITTTILNIKLSNKAKQKLYKNELDLHKIPNKLMNIIYGVDILKGSVLKSLFTFVNVLILCLAIFPLTSLSKEHSKHLTLVMPVNLNSALSKWVKLIYDETFIRLNMNYTMLAVPAKRASLLSNSGEVDGEFIRVKSYQNKVPNLIRVDEAILDLTFSAYSIDKDHSIINWQDLKTFNYRVGTMRGIRKIEEMLEKYVINDYIAYTENDVQGFGQLLKGRIDIYINAESFVYFTLLKPPYNSKIVNVGTLEKSHHYLYLHNKHRLLIPLFNKVITEMKKEGVIEKLRQQVFASSSK